MVQIFVDCRPGIGGNSRAVREHQEFGVGQSIGSLQSLQVQEGEMEGEMRIFQRGGEGGAIQRLAGNGRESRLPEDGYLGHKRGGEQREQYDDAKDCVHEDARTFMGASALKLYIRPLLENAPWSSGSKR